MIITSKKFLKSDQILTINTYDQIRNQTKKVTGHFTKMEIIMNTMQALHHLTSQWITQHTIKMNQ